MTEAVRDAYPKRYILSEVVWPYQQGEIILQVITSLLQLLFSGKSLMTNTHQVDEKAGFVSFDLRFKYGTSLYRDSHTV